MMHGSPHDTSKDHKKQEVTTSEVEGVASDTESSEYTTDNSESESDTWINNYYIDFSTAVQAPPGPMMQAKKEAPNPNLSRLQTDFSSQNNQQRGNEMEQKNELNNNNNANNNEELELELKSENSARVDSDDEENHHQSEQFDLNQNVRLVPSNQSETIVIREENKAGRNSHSLFNQNSAHDKITIPHSLKDFAEEISLLMKNYDSRIGNIENSFVMRVFAMKSKQTLTEKNDFWKEFLSKAQNGSNNEPMNDNELLGLLRDLIDKYSEKTNAFKCIISSDTVNLIKKIEARLVENVEHNTPVNRVM